jgi:hypothetical protein
MRNFRPPTLLREGFHSFRVGGNRFNGGAWYPDSPRVSVPGILSRGAWGNAPRAMDPIRDTVDDAINEDHL